MAWTVSELGVYEADLLGQEVCAQTSDDVQPHARLNAHVAEKVDLRLKEDAVVRVRGAIRDRLADRVRAFEADGHGGAQVALWAELDVDSLDCSRRRRLHPDRHRETDENGEKASDWDGDVLDQRARRATAEACLCLEAAENVERDRPSQHDLRVLCGRSVSLVLLSLDLKREVRGRLDIEVVASRT